MSVGLTIKVQDKDVANAFRRLMRAGGDQRLVLGRLGLYMRRDAQRRLRRRPHDWGPSTTRLSKSLAMRLDRYSVTVGSNLVYAAIQQLGGPVKPKPGKKFLAIPVLENLRRQGVWPRDLPADSIAYSPAETIRIGVHTWTGPALVHVSGDRYKTVTVTTDDGKKVKRRRKVVKGEVLFALVRQVKIRGRPYLVFDENTKAFLIREVTRAIKMAWRGR